MVSPKHQLPEFLKKNNVSPNNPKHISPKSPKMLPPKTTMSKIKSLKQFPSLKPNKLPIKPKPLARIKSESRITQSNTLLSLRTK